MRCNIYVQVEGREYATDDTDDTDGAVLHCLTGLVRGYMCGVGRSFEARSHREQCAGGLGYRRVGKDDGGTHRIV